MASTAALRHTPLYERHRAARAKLVPFAGWEMPIQYVGIRAEHQAVRTHAGMFDVSHMGQIETRGPQTFEFMQHLLSNDLRRLPEGGAQYSVLCNEDGHVLDDLFTYRLAEFHFLTVTNAANHERDLEWFRAHADGFDVDVFDKAADFAMLAVQGPAAPGIVAELADTPLPPRMRAGEPLIGGVPALACATGYTGEDGYELLLAPDEAASSPAGRSRPRWSAESGWRTFPPSVRSRARRSRSTCGGRPGLPASSRSPCTERKHDHGRGQLSDRSALPPGARLGARRGRHRDLRDHLVRAGF